MKKLIASILLFSISSVSFADCDYTKIVDNKDGTYTYSKELHICVGKMKQDLQVAQTQVLELNKAIELKDLAITKSSERTQLWMDTTFKVQDRLNTYDSIQGKTNTLYFLGGVGLTVLSVWAAGQLRR